MECEGGHFQKAEELERLAGCRSVGFLKIVYGHDILHVHMLANLTYINGDFMLKSSRTSDLTGLSHLKYSASSPVILNASPPYE